MMTLKRLTGTMSVVLAAALLLAGPTVSSGAGPCDLGTLKSLNATLDCVTGGVRQIVAPGAPRPRDPRPAAPARAARDSSPRQAPDQATTPPLHGTNSHGQGSVAVIDTNPDPTRPYTSSVTGNGEDIVVGRSRGERNADGSYHGHITVAALFGNEIVGVDTAPGQSRQGPLDAVQTGLLNPLCDGSGNQICLSAVTASSATTSSGSTNHFSVAHATLGGASGIDAGVSESDGNVASDGTCQTTHGDSQVANATIAGQGLVSAAKSSSDAKACRGQSPTQSDTSSVIGLGGTGVPLPAAGCANGTADTVTGIPALLPIVCNAEDANGAQATAPYGVRDALDAFVLATGTSALAKASLADAESHAIAPAATTQCSDAIDNDGDGKIDAADPGCHSDGNPANPGSYVPGGDSEADGPGTTGSGSSSGGSGSGSSGGSSTGGSRHNGATTGTGASGAPECSDGADNDGDGLIDAADPGCHTDGNPANAASYVPGDDSELDAPAVVSSGALPFTGSDVLRALLVGLALLGAGLALREWPRRRALR